MGHVDEKAPGERDLRGDPGALRADGLLGYLDDDVLALLQDVLDRRCVRLPLGPTAIGTRTRGAILRLLVRLLLLVLIFFLVLVVDGFVVHEIRGVEKRALLRADVDERGLDTGEDGVYPSDEDVTNQPFDVRSVDEQLNELVVLENGNSCFSVYCADEDFAFHRKPPPDPVHATHGRAGGCSIVEEAVRAGSWMPMTRRTKCRWRTSSEPGSSTPTPAGPTTGSRTRARGDWSSLNQPAVIEAACDL